jgi:hypothetical protein
VLRYIPSRRYILLLISLFISRLRRVLPFAGLLLTSNKSGGRRKRGTKREGIPRIDEMLSLYIRSALSPSSCLDFVVHRSDGGQGKNRTRSAHRGNENKEKVHSSGINRQRVDWTKGSLRILRRSNEAYALFNAPVYSIRPDRWFQGN